MELQSHGLQAPLYDDEGQARAPSLAPRLGVMLGVIALCLSTVPKERFERAVVSAILPLCLGCIALGAACEATIFRIAKFDEVDFINQSLGAILAALTALVILRGPKPGPRTFNGCLGVAALFFVAGVYFAFKG